MTAPSLQILRPTRFATLSPIAARAVLSFALVVGWILVAITLSPWKSGFADAPSRGVSDIDLYRAQAERIRGGERYYSVVKDELESRGYPTRNVFNWRTPLPVWLIGMLPERGGQVLLVALTVCLMGMAAHVVAKEAGLARALAVLLLLIGALLPVALAGPYYMPEVWCGVLIAASLAFYGTQRTGLAVALGLAALFVRELAAPYCVVCALLASQERRWQEVKAWVVGAIAYSAFYAWHLTQVVPLIESNARAHSEGWLQLGGAAFVISLVQMNAYLLLLPQWVSAIYLVLALLGFASMASLWGRRAAWVACLYTLAFGVVGQEFNQYWGSVIAPLFCFGAAQGLAALVDVCRAARLPLAPTWSQEDVTG
jgi:hypothetical protein